jgi:hypothetical protein
MSEKMLVIADIDQIHRYVFASQRMREIRGGSYIVAAPVRQRIIDCLHDFGAGNYNSADKDFDPTPALDGLDWKVIYCDGGALKVKFREKHNANDFRRALEEAIRQETISGSITTAAVPIDDVKRYDQIIEAAEIELRLAKDGKCQAFQVNQNPFSRLCETCGRLPVSEFDGRDPSDRQFVCRSCLKKREIFFNENQRLRIYNEIQDRIGLKLRLLKDFSEIAQAGLPENYLGFIVADGNRMGEHLQRIPFPENRPTEADVLYSRFSQAIHRIASDALIEAVIAAFRLEVSATEVHRGTITLPIEVVILGGDDLVLVTRADKALEIAQRFCREFHERTKHSDAIPSEDGISMSAGVAIVKHKFPFLTAHRLAEELSKSAKKRSRSFNRRNPTQELSTIDFMVVTEAAVGSLEEARRELKYEERFRDARFSRELDTTSRPYTVDELEELQRCIQNLRANPEGFPRNKLKGFRDILRHGLHQSQIEYKLMRRKLPQSAVEHLKPLESVFMAKGSEPWKPVKGQNYTSVLSDIAEIYDFVR